MGAFVFVPRASSNPIQSITTSSRCGFSRLEFSPQLFSRWALLSSVSEQLRAAISIPQVRERQSKRALLLSRIRALFLFPPAALPLPPKIGGH